MSIANSLCLCSRTSFTFLNIRLNIEVSEEDNERNSISNQSVVHPLGKITVNVERVNCMYNGQTKLQLYVFVQPVMET